MITVLATCALVLLLALAAIVDVRHRRIPNRLTLAGCVAGLALRAPAGVESVGSGLAGLVLAFGFGAALFAFGGMGGGDVKLMAAVGAFVGLPALGATLLAIALVGGAMALVAAVRSGELRSTLARTGGLVASVVGRGGPRRTIHTPGALTIPYGVAIALGGLYGWFGHALTL